MKEGEQPVGWLLLGGWLWAWGRRLFGGWILVVVACPPSHPSHPSAPSAPSRRYPYQLCVANSTSVSYPTTPECQAKGIEQQIPGKPLNSLPPGGLIFNVY